MQSTISKKQILILSTIALILSISNISHAQDINLAAQTLVNDLPNIQENCHRDMGESEDKTCELEQAKLVAHTTYKETNGEGDEVTKSRYEIFRQYNYCMQEKTITEPLDIGGVSYQVPKYEGGKQVKTQQVGTQCRALIIFKDVQTGDIATDFWMHRWVAMENHRTNYSDSYYVPNYDSSGVADGTFSSFHDDTLDQKIHIDFHLGDWRNIKIKFVEMDDSVFPTFNVVTVYAGSGQNGQPDLTSESVWTFTPDMMSIQQNTNLAPEYQYTLEYPVSNSHKEN